MQNKSQLLDIQTKRKLKRKTAATEAAATQPTKNRIFYLKIVRV